MLSTPSLPRRPLSGAPGSETAASYAVFPAGRVRVQALVTVEVVRGAALLLIVQQ